jgi:hypothetical protein
VRSGHADDRLHPARDLLDGAVILDPEVDAGRAQEPGIHRAGRVTDEVDVAARRGLDDVLEDLGGAPPERGGGRHPHPVDLGAHAAAVERALEHVAHVPEIDQPPEVDEAEEAGDEIDVVGLAHCSVASAFTSGVLRRRRDGFWPVGMSARMVTSLP